MAERVRRTTSTSRTAACPNNRQVAQAVAGPARSRPIRRAAAAVRRSADRRGDVTQRVPEDELRDEPYAGRSGALLSQRELRAAARGGGGADRARREPAPSAVASRPAPVPPRRSSRATGTRSTASSSDAGGSSASISGSPSAASPRRTRARWRVGVFQRRRSERRGARARPAARRRDHRCLAPADVLGRRRRNLHPPDGPAPITADYIAFVGLGSFDRFTNEVLQVAAENLIRTFVSCQVEEFATVLFGAGSGEGPGVGVRSLLGGFIRGLRTRTRTITSAGS